MLNKNYPRAPRATSRSPRSSGHDKSTADTALATFCLGDFLVIGFILLVLPACI